jgi:hypothetical protein
MTRAEDTIGEWIERFVRAIEAIQAHAAGRRGIEGTISCPSCQASLHYGIAAYNGHVHARCETPGCVDFIQ